MTTKINAAVRRRLAGSALGGLIAFAGVPAAMAQWLPPWPSVASYGDIAQRLEAQGYVLIAPLQRRPGVYLADVRAGPAGYQRLVIDDRNGEILERFMAPPRNYRPEFAARYDQFGQPPPPGAVQPPPPGAVQPPPGPGFSDAPNGSPAATVHIPTAISPYGPQSGPGSTKPKPPQSAVTARKIPPAKTAPAAGAPPTVGPPLPPPAPREAAKPEELAPPAPKPEPKIESPPGESENASTAGAPATPEAKPEAVKIEPQPEAQTQPADSALDPTAKRAAPASSVEASEKSKVSIVPPALFE
jgi:hypothetical protein